MMLTKWGKKLRLFPLSFWAWKTSRTNWKSSQSLCTIRTLSWFRRTKRFGTRLLRTSESKFFWTNGSNIWVETSTRGKKKNWPSSFIQWFNSLRITKRWHRYLTRKVYWMEVNWGCRMLSLKSSYDIPKLNTRHRSGWGPKRSYSESERTRWRKTLKSTGISFYHNP